MSDAAAPTPTHLTRSQENTPVHEASVVSGSYLRRSPAPTNNAHCGNSGKTSDESKDVDDEDDDADVADCNPEPPQELIANQLIHADTIGNTVFSKHWLFSTLMKLIQAVDGERESKDNQGTTSTSSQDGQELLYDLDDALQDELCKLWDMSMNNEVVKFLQEFKAVEILAGVIGKSRAPRATEICVGILGNMACNVSASHDMAAHGKLRELILLLLADTDTPTLVETTRLLHTVISNSDSCQPWLDEIRNSEAIHDHLVFILKSSTNEDLLQYTGNLIDKLMDVDESICEAWSNVSLIQGLLETAKQVGYYPCPTLDSLLHILQLLSTNENGVRALVAHDDQCIKLLQAYLSNICADEIPGVINREGSLAAAFSVMNVLMVSSPIGSDLLLKDYELLRCTLKVLEVVYPRLHPTKVELLSYDRGRRRRTISSCERSPEQQQKKSRQDNVQRNAEKPCSPNKAGDVKQDAEGSKEGELTLSDYDHQVTKVLHEILQGLAKDMVQVIAKNEKEDDNPKSLDYLDSACPRERIYCFAWTLHTSHINEKDNKNSSSYLSILLDLFHVKKFKRLTRILKDANP